MSFFDTPDYTKCLDCETEDTIDREILWTTEDGHHEWICPKCAKIRAKEQAAREQEEKAKAYRNANMW